MSDIVPAPQHGVDPNYRGPVVEAIAFDDSLTAGRIFLSRSAESVFFWDGDPEGKKSSFCMELDIKELAAALPALGAPNTHAEVAEVAEIGYDRLIELDRIDDLLTITQCRRDHRGERIVRSTTFMASGVFFDAALEAGLAA